jgi:cysteine-rich repeat protein
MVARSLCEAPRTFVTTFAPRSSRLAPAPIRIAVSAVLLMLAAANSAAAAVLAVPGDYATIQAAVNAAGPGDTVEVSTGVYHEFVSFPVSGTAGNPITLAAKAGHSPVIDGTGLATTDLDGLVRIEDRSWITVSGLEIANLTASHPSHFPAGIWVRGQSRHIRLLGNTVHHIRNAGCASCGAHGIAAYGTSAAVSIDDLVIDGNEVRDCVLGWSEALVVNGNVENFQITNNSVHDHNNIGIVAIGYEGECAGCGELDRARDGRIAGNLVHHIDSVANPSYAGGRSADGIYVDGGTRIVIERNIVHDANIGIELASEHAGKATSDVVVRSNFVSRSHTIGISLGGYDKRRGRTEDCAVVHNTLFDNDRDQGGNGEILLQYDTRNNRIENNVVVANAQNRFVTNDYTANTGNVIDHNLYFAAAGEAASAWTWKTAAYFGFAAWKAGSGNDANSSFVDPLLTDPASGDLHLGAGSPAVGAAVSLPGGLAGTLDIDGTPRVSGPAADLGADELACGNMVVDADEDCDDGNLDNGDGCDANCTVTACGNGIVTDGEDCDDGNLVGGDCCDEACSLEGAGSTCDDAEACTFADACDGAGTCAGVAGIEPACLLPSPLSAGSRLTLATGRLAWTWGKGDAVALPALGDPLASDEYRMCLYADDGVAARVLLSARAPAGASWKATAGAWKYASRSLAPEGLKQVLLKTGDAGRAKVRVKGQGPLLGTLSLGFGGSGTVSAALRNSSSGTCFAAVYSAPYRTDTSARFDDKSD